MVRGRVYFRVLRLPRREALFFVLSLSSPSSPQNISEDIPSFVDEMSQKQ